MFTWSLNESVVLVEVVNNEASEVEEGRIGQAGTVLGVGEVGLDKRDVVEDGSQLRRVDRLLLRRQVVETIAECRLEDGVGGDLVNEQQEPLGT